MILLDGPLAGREVQEPRAGHSLVFAVIDDEPARTLQDDDIALVWDEWYQEWVSPPLPFHEVRYDWSGRWIK